MKKWRNPEIKVFSVKMNENIAASGDAGNDEQGRYDVGYIYYTETGVVTFGGRNYRYNPLNNMIQDTSVAWFGDSFQRVIFESDVDTVVGCLA